jgi:hypothetical protein
MSSQMNSYKVELQQQTHSPQRTVAISAMVRRRLAGAKRKPRLAG